MVEKQRQQNGRECPPPPDNPADQPHLPEDKCDTWETPKPPELKDPKCDDPPSDCNCPKPPTANPNCLEQLIANQTAEISAAERAKAFRTDLEALLGKARTGYQEYTRQKYEDLRKRWAEQDLLIAELLRKLVCALPCWRCVIECYICPLLNELYLAEQKLYGEDKLYTEVHNRYDLLYWHQRNKDIQERRFNRIKSVLAAWEKPATTIDKVLNDNKTLIESAGKQVGTTPAKAVYDVFFRLVPMHLAIAPPQTDEYTTTRIAKEYTFEYFCKCDKPDPNPDDCCGPSIGIWTVRQRLIGPQPYLVDPNDYFRIICCLVEKRYGPAKDLFAKAEADWLKVDNEIKRLKTQMENGLKSFAADAAAAVPSDILCCDEHLEKPAETPQQTAR